MSSATGRRIIFPAVGEVATEEFAVPEPGPEEIVVRARHSLISAGTELTNLTDALGIATYPLYPGYSHVGVVESAGGQVGDDFAPGTAVLSLGAHTSHLLLDLSPTRAGGAEFALALAPETDLQAATFAVLGSVAMHAVRKAEPQIGQSAAVFGEGVVGQLMVQLLRVSGCRPVIAVDLDESRLAKATESGAEHTIDAGRVDVVTRLLELTGGAGVELQFDATRTPQTLPTMLKAAAHSGRILVTGSVPGKVEVDLFHELQLREISIIGVFQPAAPTVAHPYNPWTQERNRVEFLKLLADGSVRVEHLISAAPAWGEAKDVYEMIRQGPGEWLGIVFDWG